MTELLAREGLGDNVRFLLLEVSRQVERVIGYLDAPSDQGARALLERDDYIDQLRNTIGRRCLVLETDPATTEGDRKFLKALDVVSANLERIADFCENIVDHVGQLSRGNVRGDLDIDAFATPVLAGLQLTQDALENGDVQVALEICKLERDLDDLYGRHVRRLTKVLGKGKHTKRRVAAMFIGHYFERMGDSLENIGEAIISWLLGDRLKIQQISALGEVLVESDASVPLEDVELHEVGETRSGCHISRVTEANNEQLAIFKEGKLRKLASERQSVSQWQRIIPGLVPDIYSFHVRGESGAVLYEYVEGSTFQDLLLSADDATLGRAAGSVAKTLRQIWDATASETPSRASFVGQLRRRLTEVYAVHPEFRAATQTIAGRTHDSLDDLLDALDGLDDELRAPFSVRIHGDLNVDNLICRPEEGSVRMIDVHRSRTMDYVQDVSVLLVSGQRLMRLDTATRRRIAEVMRWFLDDASAYAQARGDSTFNLRLALGVARSLATSTRFVLDKELATNMFLRAHFLLRDIAKRGVRAPQAYVPDREVLID
ncbi:MAG: PhoU domain-containing protein [Myxococcota bacterium]